MRITVDKNSWLTLAPLLDYDGFTFWDTPNFPDIEPQDKDVFVDVTDLYVGRLDLLAFDQYGDVNLWWAIALANKIDLIPSGVVLGMRLRIPNKAYLQRLISRGA